MPAAPLPHVSLEPFDVHSARHDGDVYAIELMRMMAASLQPDAVFALASDETHNPRALREKLREDTRRLFLVLDEQRVPVGFIAVMQEQDAPRCEFGRYFLKAARGKHMGRAALLQLENLLAGEGMVELYAVTDVVNIPSRRGLRALGYEQTGPEATTHPFFRSGACVLYSKRLRRPGHAI